MISPLLIIPLFIAMLLQSIPLAAQSAPGDTPQTAQEPADTDDDKSDATLESTRPNFSTQKKTPPATSKQSSPLQASKKPPISEDNSSDFPVDI